MLASDAADLPDLLACEAAEAADLLADDAAEDAATEPELTLALPWADAPDAAAYTLLITLCALPEAAEAAESTDAEAVAYALPAASTASL